MSAQNWVYVIVVVVSIPIGFLAHRLHKRTRPPEPAERFVPWPVESELPAPIADLEHALATTGLCDDIELTRDDARAIVVQFRELQTVVLARGTQIIGRQRQWQFLEGRNDVLTEILRAPEAVTITRRGDAHVVRVGSHEASALDVAEALRNALESRRQFDAEHRDALLAEEGYL